VRTFKGSRSEGGKRRRRKKKGSRADKYQGFIFGNQKEDEEKRETCKPQGKAMIPSNAVIGRI